MDEYEELSKFVDQILSSKKPLAPWSGDVKIVKIKVFNP